MADLFESSMFHKGPFLHGGSVGAHGETQATGAAAVHALWGRSFNTRWRLPSAKGLSRSSVACPCKASARYGARILKR